MVAPQLNKQTNTRMIFWPILCYPRIHFTSRNAQFLQYLLQSFSWKSFYK